MTYFSGSKVFGCFEKHPKVVSGALRGGFRAREVFGSFEKRTPGVRGAWKRVYEYGSDIRNDYMTPCAKKRYKYVTQCAYVTVIANNYTFLLSNILLLDNSDKHIDVAHFLIKTAVCFLFFINSVIIKENQRLILSIRKG